MPFGLVSTNKIGTSRSPGAKAASTSSSAAKQPKNAKRQGVSGVESTAASDQEDLHTEWYQTARTRDGATAWPSGSSTGAGSGSRDAYRMPVVDLLGQFTDPGAAVVDVHAERQRRVTTPEPGVLRGEEVERERLGLTCAQAVVV
jgi:hypothetical protein